ncbi:MAG: fibronectin type III domain-containing protein, partial [Georgfuchsia sp.]
MQAQSGEGFAKQGSVKAITSRLMKRTGARLTAVGLFATFGTVALIAGCGSGGGGGGGTSPQSSVSGVAAAGAPLVGQLTLRDSSSRDRTTNIAEDGSFSVDVTDLHAPFVLKATGKSEGVSHTLYSFNEKDGTANVNPLSTVVVANAAGVDDPATVFDQPDAATLEKVKSRMHGAVSSLQTQLQPLLSNFNAEHVNPVTDSIPANGEGLDGMFDNVKIKLSAGEVTIRNATTDNHLYSSRVKDLEHGEFTSHHEHMPRHGPRPGAPTNVTLICSGDTELSVFWDAVAPVANSISYDLFYTTKANVADEEDDDDEHVRAKRVKNVTSPYTLTGLAANTTYYVMVRAIDDGRRSPPSEEVSMMTSTCETPTTTTTTTTAAPTTTTTTAAPTTTTTTAAPTTTTTTAAPTTTTTTAAPTTTTTTAAPT